MKKTTFLIFILIMCSTYSYEQNCDLKLFSDKIFLNFFSDSIHSSIRDFYESLSITKRTYSNDTTKGWSAKDSIGVLLPNYRRTSQAIYLKTHPKFNGKYTSCKFDVITGELYRGNKTIHEVSIWFYFREKIEAINFFEMLVKEASSSKTLKKQIIKSKYSLVQLSEECQYEKNFTELEIIRTEMLERDLQQIIIVKSRSD